MSCPEVHLDLLELLDELGYLEGAQWQDSRDPGRTVQVVSRDGDQVTYGNPGDVHSMNVRDFLEWFNIQTKTPSATRDGGTVSGSTSLKSLEL